MNLFEILLLGVGLSMDAFAVSVCQGMSLPKFSWRHSVVIGLWYGFFQFLMPVLGFSLSLRFAGMIEAYDHWIAFLLLAWVGGGMLIEAFKKKAEKLDATLGFLTMLKLSLATSIDALAVGVSLAVMDVSIWRPSILIGLTTFSLSACGVGLGRLLGKATGKFASLLGGLILIGLGVKILITHLFF